jgi:hypothetical protein
MRVAKAAGWASVLLPPVHIEIIIAPGELRNRIVVIFPP